MKGYDQHIICHPYELFLRGYEKTKKNYHQGLWYYVLALIPWGYGKSCFPKCRRQLFSISQPKKIIIKLSYTLKSNLRYDFLFLFCNDWLYFFSMEII